jgi:2-methylcitrate dehydratase
LDLAENLARYAHGLGWGDLGPETVAEMKLRVADALGCAVGAYDEPPPRIARSVALETSRAGGSTLIGTGKKTSPDLAAFVNGLMIRYFDFNDTYLSLEPAHPSDNLGATLGVAESEGASGRDLLLATALAYEVQCRLCDAADIRHRGWDHVNYGLVSCALAAGKLMGLGRGELAETVNIALNGHIAMRQVRAGRLSMWKGASFSNAARNAVFAALLAKHGMSGPAPIFEGEMGFFKQVSGPFQLSTARFGRSGRGFKVEETYIKYWPAEYHAQTAVWAALRLGKRVKPQEIKSVLVETHEAAYTILAKDREKWAPETKETADHSLPYIVGMALLRGTVNNATYSDSNLGDREVLRLLAKIKVREDPGLTAMYPDRGMPNRVRIVTNDGRSLSEEVLVPRGHPLNPMTEEEVESKFLGLASGKLGRGRAEEALSAIRGLDRGTRVSDLMGLLKIRRSNSNA